MREKVVEVQVLCLINMIPRFIYFVSSSKRCKSALLEKLDYTLGASQKIQEFSSFPEKVVCLVVERCYNIFGSCIFVNTNWLMQQNTCKFAVFQTFSKLLLFSRKIILICLIENSI